MALNQLCLLRYCRILKPITLQGKNIVSVQIHKISAIHVQFEQTRNSLDQIALGNIACPHKTIRYIE
jgi:hypothetical protein